MDSCPSSCSVMISHLLYNSDLFHEQPASLSGKAFASSGYAQVLTWAAAGDDVNSRYLRAVYFCNVTQVLHWFSPHAASSLRQNARCSAEASVLPRAALRVSLFFQVISSWRSPKREYRHRVLGSRTARHRSRPASSASVRGQASPGIALGRRLPRRLCASDRPCPCKNRFVRVL